MSNVQRVIGVDLGQSHDHTAIAVDEVTQDMGATRLERKHHLVHLERLPLGTPYPIVVARVNEVFKISRTSEWPVKIVVDQTGVGQAVVDLLRPGLPVVPVTITAGDTETVVDGAFRVPKRNLVSSLQVLLQSGQLQIAAGLADASVLVDELLAFKIHVNIRGHDSYGNDVGLWRENPHDDLVLATALACWWGRRPVIPPARPSVLVRYGR